MVSDSIFVYSKTNNYLLTIPLGEFDGEVDNKKFPQIERETGRKYQHIALEQNANSNSKDEVRMIYGKEYTTTLGWR